MTPPHHSPEDTPAPLSPPKIFGVFMGSLLLPVVPTGSHGAGSQEEGTEPLMFHPAPSHPTCQQELALQTAAHPILKQQMHWVSLGLAVQQDWVLTSRCEAPRSPRVLVRVHSASDPSRLPHCTGLELTFGHTLPFTSQPQPRDKGPRWAHGSKLQTRERVNASPSSAHTLLFNTLLTLKSRHVTIQQSTSIKRKTEACRARHTPRAVGPSALRLRCCTQTPFPDLVSSPTSPIWCKTHPLT